jgi:hypothetical protein
MSAYVDVDTEDEDWLPHVYDSEGYLPYNDDGLKDWRPLTMRGCAAGLLGGARELDEAQGEDTRCRGAVR